MRIAQSPYPLREFIPMVVRRFSPPPPRPAGPPAGEFIFDAGSRPEQWIGFTGDISPLPGREARYDPAVADFFRNCDFMVGNLEGVITEKRWAPYLHKHTPLIFDTLEPLAPAPRWVLSLANNHATDFGAADLHRTQALIEAWGGRWVGAGDHVRVDLTDGITLSAWTWWVNGRADSVARQDPGAPETPGLHIALPHWGYEHERKPRPEQWERIPPGYSLVVGCHSHLPQPVNRLGDRLVAWSLGNFLTCKRLPVLGEGLLLKVGVTRGPDGVPQMVRARFQEIRLERSSTHCRVVALEDVEKA